MYLCDFANLHANLHERLHTLRGCALEVFIERHSGGFGEDGDAGGPAVLLSATFSLARLTWNQPSSSPLAMVSPGFLDQPILPTSIAAYKRRLLS